MRRRPRILCVVVTTVRNALLLTALGACATATAPKTAAESEIAVTPEEKAARDFVEDLTRHRWIDAIQRFDREMTESMSPARLETMWNRAEGAAGPWVGIEQSRVETRDHVRTVVVVGRFTHRRRSLRITFDPQQRISQFWIRPVAEDLEASARGLIDALARGDMTAATKDFDPRMRTTVPPHRLEETWKSLLADVGDFVEIENLRVLEEPSVSVALATCKFTRGRLLIKVAYRQDEVAAFFLLPA